jgi:hypothetical protein
MSRVAQNPLKTRTGKASEVRALVDIAIESGNFEEAKDLSQEADSLEAFEAELKFAKTVHTYYTKKQTMSDAMYQNSETYSRDIEFARETTQVFYYNEYQDLKKRQEEELDTLLEKWEGNRAQSVTTGEEELKQTLATAKLLAQRHQFDEAIRIRNEADRQYRVRMGKKIAQVDSYFTRQCEAMLAKHENEIVALTKRRAAEMQLFNALIDAARRQALDKFVRDNATEVVRIVKRFPPGSIVPKCLQMQSVRGRPLERGPAQCDPEPEFQQLMDHVDQIIGAPLKVGTARFATRSPEVVVRKKMDLSESLLLTRSPLK